MSGLQWEKKYDDSFVLETDLMTLELQPTLDPSDRWHCVLYINYEYVDDRNYTADSPEEAQQQAILKAFEMLIFRCDRVAG